MTALRQFLYSALVFALVPPGALRGASHAVEYVGGTVKSIPANSAGTFNFDDAKELRFNYAGVVFKLPYEQITSTEVNKAEGHHLLGKIPVPSLMPGKRKQTLSISYKDPAGATGTLNFELSASQASSVRDTIALKKAPVQTATQSTDWWGDRYWKTTRNKGTWEAGNAQVAQPGQTATPAGTK